MDTLKLIESMSVVNQMTTGWSKDQVKIVSELSKLLTLLSRQKHDLGTSQVETLKSLIAGAYTALGDVSAKPFKSEITELKHQAVLFDAQIEDLHNDLRVLGELLYEERQKNLTLSVDLSTLTDIVERRFAEMAAKSERVDAHIDDVQEHLTKLDSRLEATDDHIAVIPTEILTATLEYFCKNPTGEIPEEPSPPLLEEETSASPPVLEEEGGDSEESPSSPSPLLEEEEWHSTTVSEPEKLNDWYSQPASSDAVTTTALTYDPECWTEGAAEVPVTETASTWSDVSEDDSLEEEEITNANSGFPVSDLPKIDSSVENVSIDIDYSWSDDNSSEGSSSEESFEEEEEELAEAPKSLSIGDCLDFSSCIKEHLDRISSPTSVLDEDLLPPETPLVNTAIDTIPVFRYGSEY